MQNLEFEEPRIITFGPSSYRVTKKRFWPVVIVFSAIFIVLLTLTIYFGVNQKSSNVVENRSTTTVGPPTTTTNSPVIPVERIPNNLEQLFYNLTVTPDLDDETFTGKEFPKERMSLIRHFFPS